MAAVRQCLTPHLLRRVPTLSAAASSSFQQSVFQRSVGNSRLTSPSTLRSFSAAAAAEAEAVPAAQPTPIKWTTHKLSADQIHKVDKIFHKILWLDMFESSMLTELVNEKLGVVMTKKQRRQLEARMNALEKGESGGGGAAEAKQEEEAKPALADVKLLSFDPKQKIKVIKEVRGALELGLKEAKALVEGAPVPLQKGMSPEAAAELKAKLEAAGAKIEVTDA